MSERVSHRDYEATLAPTWRALLAELGLPSLADFAALVEVEPAALAGVDLDDAVPVVMLMLARIYTETPEL